MQSVLSLHENSEVDFFFVKNFIVPIGVMILLRYTQFIIYSNFAHQKRSTDLENTDFMPMKILPLCTFS